jgi:hypothetical protein
MQDAGPRVDSGPVVPPYAPTALECEGTAPECRDADGSRTACEDIQGCDYGYCEYRLGSCYGAYASQCESGCEWDWSLEYCRRSSRGCDYASEDGCTRLAACQWSQAVSIFGRVPCQGRATACSALSQGACIGQPGCSLGCPTGREQCLGACVDTRRDDNHCGECGTACGAAASCVQGICTCDEPGFTRDLCGVCDADPSNDCVRDCAGVPGGNAVEDDCGTCDATPANDCDCAGVPGGSSVVDMCGACDAVAGNDCVQDCAGSWGGAATVDDCGVCDANPANDCDCLMVPGGPARLDGCGVCDVDPSNDCAIDCSGVWGGPDRQDMCGDCDADPSNDCVQDCSGQWGGVRTVDMCGVCDANANNDCVQDCAGTWGGTATVDNCDTCDANPTNDCVCFGQTCTSLTSCFEGYCDLVSDTCQERASADGAECGAGGTDICVATACVTRGCGDGFLEAGPTPAREGCDDANMAAGDLCSVGCAPVPLPLEENFGSARDQVAAVGVDGAGRHLVVWRRQPVSSYSVVGRRFDARGVPLDAAPFDIQLPMSGSVENPAVAGLAGGGWVVAYDARSDLRFRVIGSNGTVGAEQTAGSLGTSRRFPVVAAVGTGFVIAWQKVDALSPADQYGLAARRFSATGVALSSEITLAEDRNQLEQSPRIASSGDTWFVVWHRRHLSMDDNTIRGRFFSLNTPTSSELTLGTGVRPTVVALGSGQFAIAYESAPAPSEVRVRRVPQSAPLSMPAMAVGTPHVDGGLASIAPYGQSVLVAWRSASGSIELAAMGMTALHAGDVAPTLAELATNRPEFSLSPSPLGTWVVSRRASGAGGWLVAMLLRQP